MMRTARGLLTLAALAAVVTVPSGLPALAQTGTISGVTHRQSVLTELSPTGAPGTSRVFTQLTVEGDGLVEVALPEQATRSLRNLEGFGRPRTNSDTVIWELEAAPEGVFRRTVADSDTSRLPVSVEVSYELDGAPIAPRSLVGRSGQVTMTMVLRNLTAEPRELRYFDAFGSPLYETVDVAVPMVGSASTTLDGRFVDIDAPGAVVAGDGRGNTVVNWSVVLFEPLGSHEATLTYTATVTDAVVPASTLQVLPVDSRSFGALGSTQNAFGDAVRSLRLITTQTLLIDGNLNLLGAGASQLLDGLVQLRDGAAALDEGLKNSAAPGAQQLSDGLSQARPGGEQLADGLGELASGADRLSSGLGDARSGATQLSGGIGQLSDGSQELSAGARQLAAGAAEVDDNLVALAAGAAQVSGGLTQIAEGTSAGFPAAIAGIPQLAAGAAQLRDNVYAGASSGCTPGSDGCGLLASLQAVNALLAGFSQALGGTCQLDPGAPVCAPAAQQAFGGATQIVAGAAADLAGNQASVDGLVAGAQGLEAQLVPGLAGIDAALGSPSEPGPLLGGALQVSGGAAQLQAEGTAAVAAGAASLAEGAGTLAAGAGQAAEGSRSLVSGLGQLDDGASQLAAGAGTAASGAGELAGGLAQLDDGAQQLAAGLGDAADGAGQIAGGLGDAADGGDQLVEGAGSLSERGLQALATGVSDGSLGTALQLEQANAANDRGRALEGLPYGTVPGATASAVYQFDIAGVGSDDGPSAATRGLLALVAFAGAGVVGLAVRRRYT